MESDYIKENFDQILRALYPSLCTLELEINDNDFDWVVRWEATDNTPRPDVKKLFNLLQDTMSKECKIVFDALEPGYRQKRAAAYIAQLSPEGTFETSTGDLFDAIIKALYGDFSELNNQAAIINKIKEDHPKPE